MSDRDNGGPAFPVHPDMPLALGCTPSMSDAGMTLRDWFAGQALAGMSGDANIAAEYRAQCAFRIADAMLGARK